MPLWRLVRYRKIAAEHLEPEAWAKAPAETKPESQTRLARRPSSQVPERLQGSVEMLSLHKNKFNNFFVKQAFPFCLGSLNSFIRSSSLRLLSIGLCAASACAPSMRVEVDHWRLSMRAILTHRPTQEALTCSSIGPGLVQAIKQLHNSIKTLLSALLYLLFLDFPHCAYPRLHFWRV